MSREKRTTHETKGLFWKAFLRDFPRHLNLCRSLCFLSVSFNCSMYVFVFFFSSSPRPSALPFAFHVRLASASSDFYVNFFISLMKMKMKSTNCYKLRRRGMTKVLTSQRTMTIKINKSENCETRCTPPNRSWKWGAIKIYDSLSSCLSKIMNKIAKNNAKVRESSINNVSLQRSEGFLLSIA